MTRKNPKKIGATLSDRPIALLREVGIYIVEDNESVNTIRMVMEKENKKKCVVYIDGFNLYFSVLKQNPGWKWLNIQSLFESLRPDETVTQIKFFTALVDEDRWKSETRDKQKRYLNALSSLSKVVVIFGKYQRREVTCRASCGLTYQTPEEKKTDVNIAVNLIDDAIKGRMESAVILSGDSDLEPAVKWVRENYPDIKITVYIPSLSDEQKKRRNDFYPKIGVACKFLPLAEIPMRQFPNCIRLPDGKEVQRPAAWI